ncbi:MAG: amidophosphoribosyltransferase [Bdellovibrionota bacterium]
MGEFILKVNSEKVNSEKISSGKFKDECGVFGVWNDKEASKLTYLGLFALQHRGQESAGIVSLQGRGEEGIQTSFKGLGLVHDVFNEEKLESLKGDVAIGHVRYSTTGSNLLQNAQPLTARLRRSDIAIAHNGNIVNAHILREGLIKEGSIFQATSDTEVLLHLLAKRNHMKFMDALKESVQMLEGAFSILLMTQKKLIAIRDPLGFRPLVVGVRKNEKGEKSYIFSSETCAFDLIEAELVREIEPGEIFWVDETGEHSIKIDSPIKKAKCIFEHVYFSRPDSLVFSRSVYETRKNLGRLLAFDNPTEADIVIPVPDSGVAAALGYAEESKIPFEMGIIRNHYVGRTFIEPKQAIRNFGVKVKLNPQTHILKGKRVIVIDDSLVRGTTSKKIIGLIRQAGAKEVHLRIAAPPTTGPCFYGVDTPRKSELIASHKSVEEIREYIGADTLAYLSEKSLFKSVNGSEDEFCAACFTGKYPTPLHGLRKD